ncbi:MAG: hypothetical protein ABR84_01910 [Cryomorphaceae bacterium BACL21 MAG-121220-bin10]|jgi:MFS superfamily sulfate permease-like transporter|nr:MAG: hypothetical protein ABR84_01910 [Cryomorphaceae bacterium BACL21 MAG-121220-bin10]MDB9782687.1 SulP family inorganic anion transporter [Winogradskyella sp.]MDB9782697.1 SulP family inorganic anion transporter [Winogradskyella sp.]
MFKNIKNDFSASIVVFFVALPLCLGIALASGAPLFSGLISGIIGGIVVGALSGSKIGVSGPAAGLAAIVFTSITALGGYQNFMAAVVIAGALQIILGLVRAGIIGLYFPSAVIKGMLTGIGLIIILKQIPHFFGYDAAPEGDFAFFQVDGENTFSEILKTTNALSLGATLIATISLVVLLFWDKIKAKLPGFVQWIQAPFLAVVFGVFYVGFTQGTPLNIDATNMVNVPVSNNLESFFGQFMLPNFDAFLRVDVWVTAFTIALVASLETLLCVEATDRLDPDKNVTPTNRELWAQGVGNMISGFIGGLPVTQVIVRSSANIQSGGKTKLSAIIHGFFLLISVLLIPRLLNQIPLSVLASILLVVGYKLARPALFKTMYHLGWKQFVPFITTVMGILFTDLLTGIGIGLAVGIVVILVKSYQNSHFLHIEDNSNGVSKIRMALAEEVTFINKGAILKELNNLNENTQLELDVRKTRYLDHDIIEILNDFVIKARLKNIEIKLISEKGFVVNADNYTEFFYSKSYQNK